MLLHGYCLLVKPATLSMADWVTVLKALAGVLVNAGDAPVRNVLGKDEDSGQPSHRLHVRLSLDRTQILLHGTFDLADLDPADKTRLAKYVSTSLSGKYTPTQVSTALANNVKVFRDGDECRAWLAANRAAWEADAAGAQIAVGKG